LPPAPVGLRTVRDRLRGVRFAGLRVFIRRPQEEK
jgi:hypothetical protein